VKKILIALGILVVIIAVAVYLVIGNLDKIVKTAIEHFGSEVTQTAVRVKKVHIDLFSNKPAISLGEASIKFNLKAISKDLLVIDRITVKKPEVNYEMDAKRQGNLNGLYSNIEKSIPAGGKKESGKSASNESGPKLIINRIDFSDGAIGAHIVPLQNKSYSAKLPAIHMTNLGAPKGATGGEIAKQVLARITKTARDEVQRQVMDRYVNRELDKLKNQVNSRVESEKKKAEQSVKEQADQKLKDFLKR